MVRSKESFLLFGKIDIWRQMLFLLCSAASGCQQSCFVESYAYWITWTSLGDYCQSAETRWLMPWRAL